MGHTYLSSLEQSYQGATYYIQPILVRENKTRPITSGNLKFKNTDTIPFLESLTKRILPRMAKISRLPKGSRNTVINANIGDISDTLHARFPPIMCNKSACQNSRPLTGNNGPSQMGVVLQTKKMDLSLLELESTTLNLTKSP